MHRGFRPTSTRPMYCARLEVAIELAKKDKVAFEVKMLDKQLRGRAQTQAAARIPPEADKAKKLRMKELMDKSMTAYAEGNYIECEAFAKRAMEIDPNELAASMMVFKAKTERHFKQDQKNFAALRKRARSRAFQDVDDEPRSPTPKSSSGISSTPKNFKDLTQARLRMNAKLESREESQGHGDRGEAQGPHLHQYGQAAFE